MEYPDILSCGYTGPEERGGLRWMFIPELFPALTIIDILTSLSDLFFSNSGSGCVSHETNL